MPNRRSLRPFEAATGAPPALAGAPPTPPSGGAVDAPGEPRETIRSANALRVFEAAARRLSFTLAAAELHVTQVAVSRMVARLEGSLGLRLFVRARTGLQLTEDGAILQAAVSEGLRTMEAGLRELKRRRQSRNTVTLSLSSGFTSHWLMPRYSDFQQAVPGINLRFQLTGAILQGDVDEVDLGMRLHTPALAGPSGTAAQKAPGWAQGWAFCPEVVLPLCSPDYLKAAGPIDAAAGLGAHALIHLTSTTMTWDDYAARAGLGAPAPGKAKALGFSDSALVLQAALLGQGVALGWLSAVSGAMKGGLLVPASGHAVRTGRGYQLVARAGPVREEVAQVRDWLITEMQGDLRALGLRYPWLEAAP